MTASSSKAPAAHIIADPAKAREDRRAAAKAAVAARGSVLRQEAPGAAPTFNEVQRALGCAAGRWDNGRTPNPIETMRHERSILDDYVLKNETF